MSATTHDNQCDTGERCEMCAETGPHDTETCHCSMCRWADQQEREVTLPTFERDWEGAPRIYRRLITEADAEWFWRKGEQAGRIAEQVETRRWLAQMVEGYSERVGR